MVLFIGFPLVLMLPQFFIPLFAIIVWGFVSIPTPLRYELASSQDGAYYQIIDDNYVVRVIDSGLVESVEISSNFELFESAGGQYQLRVKKYFDWKTMSFELRDYTLLLPKEEYYVLLEARTE